MCNLYSSVLDYRQFYSDTNRVCIGKRRLSDSALLCRRAGSKRIKTLSACVKHIIRRNFY